MAEEKNSKKNQAPSPLKGAIEACGRHPFATGLFAILGFFGLIFAFYDFNVSQTQAEESSVAQAEIKSEIEQVGAMVEAGPVLAENREGFDPIEATYGVKENSMDNVTFSLATFDLASIDLTDGDLFDDINRIRQNDPSAFSYEWQMSFSVTSAADRQYVQVAPYLVFQVLDVQPIGEVGSISESGRGGAANIREFHVSLPPAEGVYFSPLVDTYTGKTIPEIDYLTLAPREPEEFVLFLSYMPGYVYTIRFGVHYKFKGQHAIHWINEGYRAGAPSEPHPQVNYQGEFFNAMHPDAWDSETRTLPDVTALYQSAAEGQVVADSGKVFRPSQLPQSVFANR